MIKTRLAFVLLLLVAMMVPATAVQAACRILDCDVDWGLFGDSCMCMQIGLTDYNGEP